MTVSPPASSVSARAIARIVCENMHLLEPVAKTLKVFLGPILGEDNGTKYEAPMAFHEFLVWAAEWARYSRGASSSCLYQSL